MIDVRRGVVSDAIELVRLRSILLAAMRGTEPPAGAWRDAAIETFRSRLSNPDAAMAAFVVDRPDDPSMLAACAVGFIAPVPETMRRSTPPHHVLDR